MKILSLGLDNSILDKNSRLAKRTIEYGEMAGQYIVIVPSKEYKKIELSKNALAYGVATKNKIASLFKIYKTAKKLILENKYDIITVQDQYYLAFIGLILARKFKVGLEIQIHGWEKYYGLRKLIAKFVIPRASAIRCVSQRLKRQLINEFGVEEEKITVVPIYTGISLPAGKAGNQELGIRNYDAKDRFVFLNIGRLAPVKNIEMQIRVLSEVVKNYQNIELLIVGDGSEKEKLKKLCCELRVTSYVKFKGWQDDLDKFYRQADVFLLTSDAEGWGLAVIEAASYGLPIIMTDVGCAREVIKDNESGIVIPVGDQQALEQAMVKLIEDHELREKLGKNAQAAIKSLPGKEETLNLYKQSWEKAMNRK